MLQRWEGLSLRKYGVEGLRPWQGLHVEGLSRSWCRYGRERTLGHLGLKQDLWWHAIVQRVPQLGISAGVVACAACAWKASQARQSPVDGPAGRAGGPARCEA